MTVTSNPLNCHVCETSPAISVDEELGVIRSVKVLGFQSKNPARIMGLDPSWGDALDQPYSYSRQAVEAAKGLYEGVGVYLDHPEFTYDNGTRRQVPRDRKTSERFGRLVNVHLKEDGLYADLEYLTKHPLAAQVAEAAKRMPETMALSHNAQAIPELKDGRVVIEQIVSVRSVDLIAEKPGTTHGLFESHAHEVKTVKVKELLEKQAASPKRDKWLGYLKTHNLLEMDMGPVTGGMEYSAMSAEEQMHAAFKSMVLAVLDDTTLDLEGKKTRIAEILDTEDKLSGGGETKKEETMSESQTTDPPATPDKSVQLMECLTLANEADIKATPEVLEALQALPTKEKRVKLLETFKQAASPNTTPRSQQQTQATQQPKYGTHTQDVAKLRGH